MLSMTLSLLLVYVAGLLFGALLRAWYTESKHDCMPHDPEECRGESNVR